eukprot:UN05589
MLCIICLNLIYLKCLLYVCCYCVFLCCEILKIY